MSSDLAALAAAIDRETADWPGLTAELAGATFGRLTVERPAGIDSEGFVLVSCRCVCQRLAVRRVVDLMAGRVFLSCRVCAPLRIRDPEAWAREVRSARERRRERRAKDPAYREREAGYARRYRARKRGE